MTEYGQLTGLERETDKPWRKWTACNGCGHTSMCNVFGYESKNPIPLCFWCEEKIFENKKKKIICTTD